MEQEIWKPIKGYECYYEISNLGRVKSLAKEWSVGRKRDTILKNGHRREGYDFVVLCVDKIKKYASVHRLVAEHFCDKSDYSEVNHKNGNKSDNRAINLEWCNRSINCKHAYDNGLKFGNKGTTNPMSKHSEEDILKIREMYRTGHTQTEIGEIFNCSQKTVSKIVLKQRWAHI